MNENVWDPVTTWQASLPGSMTECPEKLPEINLLVPKFLTAMLHPEVRVMAACLDTSQGLRTPYPWRHTWVLLRQDSQDTVGLRVPSFLIYPPSLSIRGKSEECSSSQREPSLGDFPG